MSLDRLTDWPATLDLGSDHYCLLLLCGCNGLDEGDEWKFAEQALNQGLVGFAGWGTRADEIETAVDGTIVLRLMESGIEEPEGSIVGTTAHKETIDEALFYFLECMEPDKNFQGTCGAWVVAAIDMKAQHNYLLERIVQPEQFLSSYVGEGPG